MSRRESSLAGRSPSWKNPRDRLKKHLKRTLSNRSLLCSSSNLSKTFDTEYEAQEVIPGSTARSNPFKRSTPLKKRRRNEEDERVPRSLCAELDDTNANDPFSNENLLCNGKLKRSCSRLFTGNAEHSLRQSLATDFSDILLTEECSSAREENECCSEKVPFDTRLGTKLRIVSKKPFPWMRDSATTGTSAVRITGQERHEGLRSFTKAVAAEFTSSSPLEVSSDVSPMAILESACLSFQFPCFPWLPAYPRADSLISSSTVLNHSIPPLPKQCLDALDMQWTECFDQLFLSWKKGDRRSFYMCSSSFTVLFTKTNLDDDLLSTEDSSSCFHPCGGLRHIVIVTPCTVGFRQYLKSEGIDYEVINKKSNRDTKTFTAFKLPHNEDSTSNMDWLGVTESQPPLFTCDMLSTSEANSSHNKENASSEERSDESPNKADVSGDHEWLENIDISPRKASKLKRYKSMGSMTNLAADAPHNKQDGGDVAAVLVKGSEVQTLYNLLQSSRVCRSIAGPYANIPPTLISSAPFLHAHLQTLKKTSQIIRKKQLEYVLELDEGPVMPHAIPLVVDFIRRAGLCNEECATVRVNDRAVCNGLNDVDDELHDWNEIQVYRDNIRWRKS